MSKDIQEIQAEAGRAASSVIPFLKLGAVNAPHEKEITRAMAKVVDSGWYIRGQACGRFEQRFATYCGVDLCVGVGNGLDALTLVFLAWKMMGVIRPKQK